MSYRPPYYKMYPQDYLSSPTTRGMTLAEHGVYRKLLDHAWLEEPTATLPADLGILSKLTGIDRRILCKFTVKYRGLFRELAEDSQRVYNPRQMAEYQEFLQTVEKNRLAGLASGKARQSKRTPVQHPLNHKEVDTDKEVREEKNNTAPAAHCDVVPVAVWLAFVEMRKKIRKPLTERAGELIRNKLRQFQQDGEDPVAVLEQSIMNSWAGVFSVKERRGSGKQSGSDLAIQNARALGLTRPN